MTSNLMTIKEKIKGAEKACGREDDSVTLVAVSKVHVAETIMPVLEAGQRIFGENRVQEAAGKWPAMKEAYPDVELHLIGPLQTNKVRQAIDLFDVIETVDRPKLARALARIFKEENKSCDIYIQVNTGHESQKAGIAPEETDDFITLCRNELGLPVKGVMCIPPFDEDGAEHFKLLKSIADRNKIDIISMGMSGDFEQAIKSGATHVRVGTAVFGKRPGY
ncbi:MAG: YggS family pyridoxal phosphate-dependent enzyme [Kordiimonadaceae bacterium]|jgi:PLP dependent protein|nr:YggS family pyridoxal phosphate-dependent enzyme [Kordiimonadaceae bacterium]MBT6035793.1 YggS family pyridoxal phosphate-dependent enzyme [Kordiimonadaceae bacterium]MBT6329495.1 YggS family pyridoxal phosphate-dependent enzyme [Kordiimonadaceae bacterium]MBT7581637.1 YggS family pyridoxal phosphate-dependent enzyme [Kordiimonadaceae bacterium]